MTTGAQPKRNRTALIWLVAACSVWAVCGVFYLILALGEVVGLCDAVGGSNNVGEERWQIWPPGKACVYEPEQLPPTDLETGQGLALEVPVSPATGLALVLLLTFPVGVVAAMNLNRRIEPDS